MGHRLRRITADWDFKNPFKVAFCTLRALKLISGKQGEQLILKKSHSKGWHCFLWTRANGERLQLRKHIGDDKIHIFLDTLHRNGKQTLFSHKQNI